MNGAAGTGPPPHLDRRDPFLVLVCVLYTPLHLILVGSGLQAFAAIVAMAIGFTATLFQRKTERRFHTLTLGVYLVWMATLATLAVAE